MQHTNRSLETREDTFQAPAGKRQRRGLAASGAAGGGGARRRQLLVQPDKVLVVRPATLPGLAAREQLQARRHPALLPPPLQQRLLTRALPIAAVGHVLVASPLRWLSGYMQRGEENRREKRVN